MEHGILAKPETTEERFWREQSLRARSGSYGGTVEGLAICRAYTAKLAAALEEALDPPSGGWERKFKASLRRLKPQDIAGVTLWATISAIAQRREKRSDAISIKIRVGNAIRAECDLKRLAKKRPGTYDVVMREMADEGDLGAKRRVAKHWAEKSGLGFRSSAEMDLRAGIWLWALCLHALPEVFYEENGVPEIRPEAVDVAFEIAELHMRQHPVFSPQGKPPKDWTGYRNGAYWTHKSKYSAPFVRNVHHPEDEAMFKTAMRRGEMREHMAGVSALQRVPFTINWRILDLLGHIERLGLLKVTSTNPRTRKRQQKNNYKRIRMALLDAVRLWRFWVPKNCDRRGRVYNGTHFSMDREDFVRALFLFADGEPIGEEGLRLLKVHLANCGDFDKISKRPFAERVAWVDANLDKIRACAANPLEELWWREADAPFMFLAACFELVDALKEGPTFRSRLPVAFDGTCSGIQHLALMARSEAEAALVNLVPSDTPRDIYQEVADRVKALLGAANDPLAQACLGYGIDRKLIKPCVMTFPYSVSASGMRKQLKDAIKERGMKPDSKAVGYLIKRLREAIAEVAPGAVAVQEYLRQIAGVMAKLNLPVRWTSPTGFPCISRAEKPLVKTIDMVVEIAQIGRRYQHRFTERYRGISEPKARNRISPNVTHSMDAAHLIRVANACQKQGIANIAMIHDSFCCPAAVALELRKIVWDELVKMYRGRGVLAQIRDRAERDIAANPMAAALFKKKKLKLPDIPDFGFEVGPFAAYAFS